MRRWTGRIAVTFALWVVVAVAAWILGNQPRPGLLALYLALGAALVWLFLDVSADTETTRWPGAREEPVRDRAEDPRLGQLRRVIDQHLDAREVGDGLRRRLAELADQRLMAGHGITREGDPVHAADLLGADLVDVIEAPPPYPRLSQAQISQLLQRIENL